MANLSEVVKSLEELFQACNIRFYNGELEAPIITVSPDTTGGAYGWCTAWKAWEDDHDPDSGYYEINICAEHLNRPFSETVVTMLHEMVHLYNLYAGVKDTSRGGTYHNKFFKAEAERRGLRIEKDSKYGWTVSFLNDEGKEFVGSIETDSFRVHRSKMLASVKNGTGKGSSSRKYVCPGCGCIIRATKEVFVVCGDCDETFELEE